MECLNPIWTLSLHITSIFLLRHIRKALILICFLWWIQNFHQNLFANLCITVNSRSKFFCRCLWALFGSKKSCIADIYLVYHLYIHGRRLFTFDAWSSSDLISNLLSTVLSYLGGHALSPRTTTCTVILILIHFKNKVIDTKKSSLGSNNVKVSCT